MINVRGAPPPPPIATRCVRRLVPDRGAGAAAMVFTASEAQGVLPLLPLGGSGLRRTATASTRVERETSRLGDMSGWKVESRDGGATC